MIGFIKEKEDEEKKVIGIEFYSSSSNNNNNVIIQINMKDESYLHKKCTSITNNHFIRGNLVRKYKTNSLMSISTDSKCCNKYRIEILEQKLNGFMKNYEIK
ncbi:hypothetical protein BCR32DRAFT_282071 [Anaeromyces robustus]|uniref:Uncharacterized protein n=1 Tax=Anaeromyces robustus TaxID=1754192 RepID=A0A1Y1WZ92_9FUNG|nr:hypothetical protein BCR32DRAFT_282071 [Anaeromyces robustus]|eukprot:ORX78668.1 hypothetical protein BCR32DRAFT_282071 [Anaeromyces robustus]